MREFLARTKTEHAFDDVRKVPRSPTETLALVRSHRHAIACRGASRTVLDPRTATDAEILKCFLGREGTLRAPTISIGDTIIAGYGEAEIRAALAAIDR